MPEEILELRDAAGAFTRIEEWLSEHGFFAPGAEGLVADLYLGYGLSETIRRARLHASSRALSRAPSRRLQARGPAPGQPS